MTLDHRSTSLDIAEHIRRTEGSGPWLHPPRRPERRGAPGGAVMLLIAAIAWGAVAFVAGYALGDTPPSIPTGPGYDICMNTRC